MQARAAGLRRVAPKFKTLFLCRLCANQSPLSSDYAFVGLLTPERTAVSIAASVSGLKRSPRRSASTAWR